MSFSSGEEDDLKVKNDYINRSFTFLTTLLLYIYIYHLRNKTFSQCLYSVVGCIWRGRLKVVRSLPFRLKFSNSIPSSADIIFEHLCHLLST